MVPMEKREEVEIRRAPKLLAWALTGAVFGLVFATLLYVLIPEANRSSEDVFGLLLVALGSLGLGLGVAFSLFFDLFSSRRVKRAEAVRSEKQSD
ncbi:hypothetical protein AKACHI_12560 [Aquiluna sp. KACHI24]|nr:hypothetical protein AKACHI_12560 [Aquiluna sp. KACHI24]